jgi:hypothetical protein
MHVLSGEKTTYLFLNGIVATRPIIIGVQVFLQPSKCAYNESILKGFSGSDISYGVALMFLPLVSFIE